MTAPTWATDTAGQHDEYSPDADSLDALVNDRKLRVPRFLRADQITLTPPRMLVRGWFPTGAVTLIAGRPGAGKGIVMADIIARGTRGEPMPNGDRLTRPFSSVIVCAAGEDGATDWRLRLEAADADPTRYRIVEDTIDDIGYDHAVTAADLVQIMDTAAADGHELVVIDSLSGIAGDVDTNKTEVRERLLNPLARRARTLGLAVVMVHHVRKSGGDILEIVSGSTQIVATCRSVLVVVQERDSETEARFLAVSKLNGSRRSGPVAFTTAGRNIADDDANPMRDDRGDLVYVPVVAWGDRTVTDAEVSAAANNTPTVTDEVAEHLRDLLAGGPLRSTVVAAEMSEGGFTRDQVKHARQRIGAATIKIGTGDHAGWWTLPPGTPKAEGRDLVEQRSAS